MSALLEICVDSPRGLNAAIAGGAQRIELCSALALGGLSPTPGLLRLAAGSPVPVYAMVRPRPGDFVFDADDMAAMLAEIALVREHGLAGAVLGASAVDRSLDVAALARLRDAAAGLGTTLHRAFDLVPDQSVALEQAISLGFERILTSGGAVRAIDGAKVLAALVAQAGERIAIMAGAGVRPDTVAELIALTGVSEVHASGRAARGDLHDGEVALGFRLAGESETSATIVTALRAAIVA